MMEAKNLFLSFGDKQVLQNVSISFDNTGITALTGPSGSGKTTLARVLAGLQKPDRGSISGINRVSFLFQEDRLLPWLTVRQNIEVPLNTPADLRRAFQALCAVELESEADSFPGTLSGGMRRRVALVRALAYPADLLILDEPFKGLDADLQKRLYPLLIQEGNRRAVLLITHSQADVDMLANRVFSMEALQSKK